MAGQYYQGDDMALNQREAVATNRGLADIDEENFQRVQNEPEYFYPSQLAEMELIDRVQNDPNMSQTQRFDVLRSLQQHEENFVEWYTERAHRTGLGPNPYDPRHGYDYKAYYWDNVDDLGFDRGDEERRGAITGKEYSREEAARIKSGQMDLPLPSDWEVTTPQTDFAEKRRRQIEAAESARGDGWERNFKESRRHLNERAGDPSVSKEELARAREGIREPSSKIGTPWVVEYSGGKKFARRDQTRSEFVEDKYKQALAGPEETNTPYPGPAGRKPYKQATKEDVGGFLKNKLPDNDAAKLRKLLGLQE